VLPHRGRSIWWTRAWPPYYERDVFDGMLKKDKGRTPWWKVVPFMVVIALVIGYRTCRLMEVDEADRQQRESEAQHRH